jgi:D-alanine-D-alanine ligase-like ATP-grasp enzyme
MYPKLWENEGIEGTKLVDRLIELAMENGKDK